MKKIISLVSCVTVLGSIGIAEARQLPLTHPAQSCSPTSGHTLKMEVESQKVVVAAGTRAHFLVKVTRGLDEHNHPRQAAEGVRVWITLSPERRPLFGAGITDETGTALVTIPIPRRAPRGWLDAVGHARINYPGGPCLSPSEVGRWQDRRVVRVISSN